MGFYSPATLIQDARRHGVTALPPCVLLSDWDTTVEADDRIRLGLRTVREVSRPQLRHALEERIRKPFDNLRDFLRRTRFSRDERRALARFGALNALAGHRRAALWAVEEEVDPYSLFEQPEINPDPDDTSPLDPMSVLERIQADYATLGLTTGSHPLARFRKTLRALDLWRASDLPDGEHGQRLRIGGSVICRQRPGTAKGFCFISLEDETGIANAIVHPTLFDQRRLVITQEHHLLITGILQKTDQVIALRAESVEPLPLQDTSLPPRQTELQLPVTPSHDFH